MPVAFRIAEFREKKIIQYRISFIIGTVHRMPPTSSLSAFAAATQSPDEVVIAAGKYYAVQFLANMTMQYTLTSR